MSVGGWIVGAIIGGAWAWITLAIATGGRPYWPEIGALAAKLIRAVRYRRSKTSKPCRGFHRGAWTDDGGIDGEWMVRIEKEAAGRLLDGREHNDRPPLAHEARDDAAAKIMAKYGMTGKPLEGEDLDWARGVLEQKP